jgi:hypothetical protein
MKKFAKVLAVIMIFIVSTTAFMALEVRFIGCWPFDSCPGHESLDGPRYENWYCDDLGFLLIKLLVALVLSAGVTLLIADHLFYPHGREEDKEG